MSHISTAVEYGLHCLLHLSALPAGSPTASARDLAELQGVPAEFVAKIFTRLHRANIVAATEGVSGGMFLARPAAAISVLDVVLAIDGDKPLFECREIRSRCVLFEDSPPSWATRGPCSIHAVMQLAEANMRDTLSGVSLADLAEQVSAKAPASYGTKVVRWLGARKAGRRGGGRPAKAG